MKRIIIAMLLLTIGTFASEKKDFTSGVKLINECGYIKNIKYKLGLYNSYGDKFSYGLQYGFKNDSNKTIKVKTILNFKDFNKNIIADISRTDTIKPHYSKGFDTSSYWAKDVNEVGDDFSGVTELKISCEDEKNSDPVDKKRNLRI